MGVREAIGKNSGLGVGLVVVLLVGAAVIYSVFGRTTAPARTDKAFFSDDDGKTFFEDAATRVSGSDHGGKPAYRAYVFQCGSGVQFVGYLERDTTDHPAAGPANGPAAIPPSSAPPMTRQIKQPGGSKWLTMTDPGYSAALQIHCPGGSTGDMQPISP